MLPSHTDLKKTRYIKIWKKTILKSYLSIESNLLTQVSFIASALRKKMEQQGHDQDDRPTKKELVEGSKIKIMVEFIIILYDMYSIDTVYNFM